MEESRKNKLDQKNNVMKSRKAAMYVRMSTDHQKYSTENQADKIREYAAQNKIEIITTYADEGKSGLSIEGRDALKKMIDDVQTGVAEFNVILVLDVTRWGRFQDADESAYYEYICRRAGIEVQYVAEQFENDGSPVSTIVKGVKRAMAGEYSRELSAKVFAGQCRLIEMGYKQGGYAGYGLRRMLIDEQGDHKTELKIGEQKSLQTDRVILVPGPEEEVKNVEWIYKSFANDRMQESQIANLLNQRGIKTDLNREWTRATVHQLLTNEKYIGNNVFNRTSFKLKKQRVVNDPDMWIRADGVFEGIVDPNLFYTVQGMVRERSRKFSNEELLEKLKSLHEKHGWLSGMIIDETENMPSSGVYSHRFGSLIRAYELIGFTPNRDYSFIEINRNLRKLHSTVIKDAIAEITNLGGTVRQDLETELLVINEEFKASVIICRCNILQSGSYRWTVHLDTGLLPDITIAIRMDANNESALDYYLLPSLDMDNLKIRFKENNAFDLDTYRFENMDAFFMMAERVKIPEAA